MLFLYFTGGGYWMWFAYRYPHHDEAPEELYILEIVSMVYVIASTLVGYLMIVVQNPEVACFCFVLSDGC
jgi:hypothetical protein